MPVVTGTEHKRVWQYKFRPQPFEVLDKGWDAPMRQFRHDVVERLRRGEGGPQSLAFGDVVGRGFFSGVQVGWEATEDYARNADRSGSSFLNDIAIERRLEDRARRKQAYEEFLKENGARLSLERARQAQADAERQRVREEERLLKAEKARKEAEQRRQWEAEGQRLQEEQRRRRAHEEAAARATDRARERERILNGQWECNFCRQRVSVLPDGFDGYCLRCLGCGHNALINHDRLVNFIGMNGG